MERSDRMKKAYEYLRFQGIAGTQEDVADMLNRQRTNVSSALNGNPKYLTDKFIENFCKTFGTINPNWLLTGEGSMLTTGDITQSGNGNNNANIGSGTQANNDNRSYCNGCGNEENAVKLAEPIAGATPFYEDMPVSAGEGELATALGSMKPTGWISMPGMPKSIGAFPVVGCSMEPDIKAGDFIAVAEVERWEAVDPEKVYMVITRDDRMIKHLAVDEENEDFLWCISPNYPRFKVYKSDILFIYRVTFHGRFR